jgi:ketosteroid isomerase-like protein
VTLANPYGPPMRGWEQVARSIEHASSLRSDGEFVGSEVVAKYVTAELAYVVQLERAEAKIGGREDVTPYAVRSTMIFRPEEDGAWKVVHRHADPITTAQPAESVIQN